MLARQLLSLEWRRGVQNPVAAGQGEMVPNAVPVREVGQNAPVGRPRFLGGGEIPEADKRRAAPSSWLCRWCCEIVAGLQSECRHLVHLVTEGKMIQGPQDSISAFMERL
jgi:hypothetical protein